MAVGISTYAFTWRSKLRPRGSLTLTEMVEQTRSLGGSVLQICDYEPIDRLGRTELLEVRDVAASNGVRLELGTRGVEPETLRRYFKLAEALGASLVRTMYAKFGDCVPRDIFERNLAAAGEYFGDAGIRLSIETYELISTHDLVSTLRRLGNPWLGICLDPANSLAALELPQDVVLTAAPFVSSVHVKDFGFARREEGFGFEVTGRRLGDGQLDYQSMLDAIEWQGTDINFILEHWLTWQGSAEATCETEIEWTRHGVQLLLDYLGSRTGISTPPTH
jgi:sugar phosphate isomerase/epimerase